MKCRSSILVSAWRRVFGFMVGLCICGFFFISLFLTRTEVQLNLKKEALLYCITYQSCGGQYSGETVRPLRVRIRKHLNGRLNSRSTTAVGRRDVPGEGFGGQRLATSSRAPTSKALGVFWMHSKTLRETEGGVSA